MPQLLLVEDDLAIRSALARALSERGHGVRTAATGMEGLQQAVADRPDLVVLDLGLPDVEGTTVLSMLRAVSDVPVIVATAQDDERVTVRAQVRTFDGTVEARQLVFLVTHHNERWFIRDWRAVTPPPASQTSPAASSARPTQTSQ